MQPAPEDIYAERVKDGTYADILAQLEALGPAALANVTYGEQFVKAPGHDDTNCQTYIDNSDGSEFTTILLGQVTHSSFGTRLSAAGNKLTERVPINDTTIVKDVLVLSPPTLAPTRLMNFYQSQIATLAEIRDPDKKEEKESGNFPAFVKECIKRNPKDRNAAMDLITVTLPQKYVVPPSGKDGVKVEQSVRVGKKRAFDDDDDSETKATSVKDNEECKIELGAYYPPHLLPDHRGPFFEHKRAQLVQLDIRDIDDKLVAPWDMYDKLRPGTLVLVHATVICWIMKDRGSTSVRKIYQLVGHSVRIMAESIEAVEEPTIPVLPLKTATPSPAKPVSKAFNNVQPLSPLKKRRL